MAYTERYVTQAAGGGGVGSSGDPWTLAEALTNAVANDRVNIQSDSAYSIGADSVTNAGSAAGLIVFRGYDTTIGDLENQGRNADGTLDTTGFPAITLTGILTPNIFVVFQNLAVTGSLGSALFSSGSVDNVTFVSCEIINTANNSGARVVVLDQRIRFINCDLECTGAAHGRMIVGDIHCLVYGCRLKSAEDFAIQIDNGTIIGNVFIGPGTGGSTAVAMTFIGRSNGLNLIANNTIYNWHLAIEMANTSVSETPIIINNHVTDCAEYINDLAAASYAPIEISNRTRDNTTPRTGVGNSIIIGEVTTDAGGPETDYTDEAADDLSLISGAPGVDTGMGFGS